MREISLLAAIVWSITALWDTYRVLSDLPRLKAQACWITVGDILWLICGFALAIYYWVIYVKGKKKKEMKIESTKD